jgi:hypothetical protein
MQKLALLAAIVGLSGAALCAATPADALAIYTDPVSYADATAGLATGAYTAGITRTDYLTTLITLDPTGFAIVSRSTATTRSVGLGVLDLGFSFAAGCEFSPGCVVTAPLETQISFDQPILAFSATLTTDGFDMSVDGLSLPMTYLTPIFFGIVGPISTLDFRSSGGFTDNPEFARFTDVAIAVPEPASSIVLFGAGLIGFGMMWRRHANRLSFVRATR